VKCWTLACIAVATLLPSAAPAQTGVLRLPWSQWQVYTGSDPQCFQLESPACGGERVVFEDWGSANVWLRAEVSLPPDLKPSPQLGLLVQGYYPVYEVFINGQKIGSSGDLAQHTGPQYEHAIFAIPSGISNSGRLFIAIHSLGVHSSNHVDPGVPSIAPMDRLASIRDSDELNYLRSSWLHYLSFAAMFGIGVVFFLLFAINTHAHEYFWLGARLSVLLVFRIGELATIVNLSMPLWLALVDNGVFNAIGTLMSIEFVFSFLGRPVPRFFRIVEICGLSSSMPLVPLLFQFSPRYFPVYAFTNSFYMHHIAIGATLLSALSFFLLVPMCFKSPLPEMRWIGAATLFFAVEESNRMVAFIHLPSLPQDLFWHGVDIDLRGISNLLFAMVMLVAMTFRLRRLQDRNRAVEQELAAARGVQQILIPDQLPTVSGLLIQSAYLPAQEVGGDFFQILPISDAAGQQQGAFIVLGDVSGKGLKAAMTVSLIVGTLRAFAETCHSPGELLTALNRRLCGHVDGFATCLAVKIDASGNLTLANAAHPNPYLDGVEIQTEANLPLGLAADLQYTDRALALAPNQTCTLLTDGVIEATSAASHELFGFDRTQSISGQSASSIAEAARVFGQGAPQADDITVLTIARVPVADHVMA